MTKTFSVVAVVSLCLALWVRSCRECSDDAGGSDDVSSGARPTTHADLEALRPPCGIPLTLWNADNTPNQEAFDLLTARLSALPEPGPDSFYTATRDLYAVDVTFGMDFVKRMGVLFDGPRLRQEDYRRCLARIRSTPRAEVQKWAVELRRLAQLSADPLDLWMATLPAFRQAGAATGRIDGAVVIVLTDAFFPDERFDADILGTALGRD
jgi:hypothetical protein